MNQTKFTAERVSLATKSSVRFNMRLFHPDAQKSWRPFLFCLRRANKNEQTLVMEGFMLSICNFHFGGDRINVYGVLNRSCLLSNVIIMQVLMSCLRDGKTEMQKFSSRPHN